MKKREKNPEAQLEEKITAIIKNFFKEDGFFQKIDEITKEHTVGMHYFTKNDLLRKCIREATYYKY